MCASELYYYFGSLATGPDCVVARARRLSHGAGPPLRSGDTDGGGPGWRSRRALATTSAAADGDSAPKHDHGNGPGGLTRANSAGPFAMRQAPTGQHYGAAARRRLPDTTAWARSVEWRDTIAEASRATCERAHAALRHRCHAWTTRKPQAGAARADEQQRAAEHAHDEHDEAHARARPSGADAAKRRAAISERAGPPHARGRGPARHRRHCERGGACARLPPLQVRDDDGTRGHDTMMRRRRRHCERGGACARLPPLQVHGGGGTRDHDEGRTCIFAIWSTRLIRARRGPCARTGLTSRRGRAMSSHQRAGGPSSCARQRARPTPSALRTRGSLCTPAPLQVRDDGGMRDRATNAHACMREIHKCERSVKCSSIGFRTLEAKSERARGENSTTFRALDGARPKDNMLMVT